MSKHTPGPWELRIANGEIHAPAMDAEDESTHVATMRPTCVTSRWEADAHLIAAAPDLSAALTAAPVPPYGFLDDMNTQQKLDWLCSYGDWWKDVRGPAIAKAEGR